MINFKEKIINISYLFLEKALRVLVNIYIYIYTYTYMVASTSITVRLTEITASKKKGLKKFVT